MNINRNAFHIKEPECLPKALNKMYACEVSRQDHLVRKDGGKYDAVEYEEHPERYISVFAHKVRKKILVSSLVFLLAFVISFGCIFITCF